MATSLIVIRLVPPAAVAATPAGSTPPSFTDYLAQNGGLQITAYDLSFGSPTTGTLVGTGPAVYIAPTSQPSPLSAIPIPPGAALTPATYAAGTGIVQQIDLEPAAAGETAYYQFESVATAVIEFTPPGGATVFENLRLIATWVAGGAQAIPITQDYYDVPLAPGPTPADPNTWSSLSPSLYLTVPPPATPGATNFTMPSNGTAPPFDNPSYPNLKTAIEAVLNVDPGGALPDFGKLTFAQCQNIAYEIVWSQQPPLPTPPDPIEDLYTNPPNTGSLISSGTTPNQDEGDRQQFQATLTGYYALANATADRLTNFVFSFAMAVACEEQSLAATQVYLVFPSDPAETNSQDAEVILGNVGTPKSNFGVPAAYFYALTANMPTSMLAQQRYSLALAENLQQMLSDMTSSFNAGVITDSEAFVTSGMAAVNMAQAVRRMQALNVPQSSSLNALPLDAIVQPLVTDWLNLDSGLASPSSQNYQTSDELKFWSSESTGTGPSGVAGAPAFLELVLWALTQGYMIPAPTNTSLAKQISTPAAWPPSPPSPTPPPPPITSIATLVAVTNAQWTAFFNAHPAWLPAVAQSGNLAARISNFLAYLQRFFSVSDASVASTVYLVTTTDANPADTFVGKVLTFVSTTGVAPGMSVSGAVSGINTIHPGTTVAAPPPPNPTATQVTLSKAVTGDVPAGTTITFTSNYATSGTASGWPVLPAPSTDWLGSCLAAYGGGFTFGSGFNLTNLQTAAGTVFPNDPCAQTWLVNALVAIDGLYQMLAIEYVTTVDAPTGDVLTFASTNGIGSGMSVSGTNIRPDTTVAASPTATTVTLSNPVSGDVPAGSKIKFTFGAPNLQFSVVEALYARGFTSAAKVTELSSSDFQAALTGTVAYDYATAIFAAAQTISPNTAPSSSGGTFHPINPDGLLTNCIPAPCRSPLGAIEYLHEMLQVSPSGTCSDPFAAPATGQNRLGTVIAQRRGPLGQLAASCANLETPLPLIDIVNECLEFMASTTPVTANGTVYNTSSDAVAGYELCHEGCPPDEKPQSICHDPGELLCALPEYSTPGTPAVSTDPMKSNQNVEPAVYNILEWDFSACCMPYSQALDVNRTYLHHLSTCRFEVMRTFRKCITEFVLKPDNQPAGFENYLWRYPVRIDIAIEYLGITPEELQQLFGGVWPQSCGPAQDDDRKAKKPAIPSVAQMYGFTSKEADNSWQQTVVQLPEFLRCMCLTYCEFLQLWKSQFVMFSDGGDEKGNFPDCEPCCLERHWLKFPNRPAPAQPGEGQPLPSQPVAPQSNQQSLGQLATFIRLWRKLKDVCNAGYSFAQLRDICDVLQLFKAGSLNLDFIRQLAAFQILRDQFRLPLVNPAGKPATGAIDADRTQILSLWKGESAAQWPWGVRQLCEGIERHARCRHKCDHRSAEFVKMLASNLDDLSVLAGFDPTSATDTWQALPTHTLRFAEVLSKLYASRFHTDEIFYLFTSGLQSEAGNLFPSQGNDDALEFPLNLPEDEQHHSLWKLRHRLLEARVSDEDVHHWSWDRIETSLREEFGYKAPDILAFGQHFFPSTLQSAGYAVSAQQRRYSSNLPAGQTTPGMWSTPATGPFQYDATNGVLFIQLPLSDKAFFAQLEQIQQLNASGQNNEQSAVQDLYFQPRATLAPFAFLFTDFAEAQQHLIQESEEHERWNYFRRQFALCHARCKILAEHLASHVDFATHQEYPEGVGDAFVVLRELYGDENNPGNWENDSGNLPAVPWPGPNGSAFAALLGLTGTGLLMEYTPAGGSVIWRDLSGPLYGFGRERDHMNCPLPTVIPSLGLTLTAAQLQNVSILNGIAADGVSGAWLGGGQGFTVTWSGALLIDRDGVYEFCAGAPTDEGHRPNMEAAEHCQWRVSLTRDGKTRVVLNHNWSGQTGHTVSSPHLKAGFYDIVVESSEPSPPFSTKHERHLQTGFQVKYMGPDTEDRMLQIPHSRLFRVSKDLHLIQTDSGETHQDLGYGITGLAAGANNYLNGYYSSSLRDIRRTYQRAFKALLFVHRFPLSSKRRADGHSELGFMLANPANFAGLAYYSSGGAYVQHAADFDFNFLPLVDNYHAPTPAQDSRTQPSAQQSQAMFDWFERLFDYVYARDQVWSEHRCELWALFDEAMQNNPTNPGDLLRHMGARKRDWPLDLRYYQDQFNSPYAVSSSDLADDRWVVRVWHADRLVRVLLQGSSDKDAAKARPDLWASDDPSSLVGAETVTGNANLSTFLCDRCFNYDSPRHYDEVRKLNDGLRERGRRALICYLCAMDRVGPLPWTAGQFAQQAGDLSNLLLLDVEGGLCEKASRIEEAITALQNFIRRARLGLEPSWPVTCDFAQMWDRHFASFHLWQACKRRHLYKENYIEWEELEKSRQIEAFRLLETQLRRDALSIGAPGGLEWWPDQRPPAHSPISLLQKVEPDETRLLSQEREGFTLMGTLERDAQPSWLAVVQSAAAQGQAPASTPSSLPFWLESAIRMGQRFWRIAAAGVPPASADCKCLAAPTGECCKECGCKHCPLVDEYFFWLVPGRYYYEPPNPQQNGQAAPTPNPDDYQYGFQDDFYSQSEQQSGWQDPTQLPQMLLWNSSPMVRLAWCRVHNGEFQQPRTSSFGVPVQDNTATDLTFGGRTADSLIFSVSNPYIPSPPPVLNDPSAPGFRYDLASDCAVVLPQVTAPPAPPTYLGNLPCYPYFVYVAPGNHLLPLSYFSPANAIARALRTHCNFEAALKWYRLAFDPLNQDSTWIECPRDSVTGDKSIPAVARNGGTNGACCDSTKVSIAVSKNRSIVLDYLETLKEFGEAEMRRNSPEHFQQARLLFDTMELILGKRPVSVQLPEPATPGTVATYQPDFPPLNPRLMDLYDVTRDRLGLIHDCLNAWRLRDGCPRSDMPYFGNSPLREGWKTPEDHCCEGRYWCHLHSPYRFLSQIQKAKEYAAKVSQLGSQLLAAYEKGDAEYLASLRANQERQILDLQLAARQDQWRDADWQVEALQKTKAVSEANLAYYQLLIQNGLITDEIGYQDLTIASTVLRAAGDVLEGIAGGVELTPNTFTGGAGFGGSPLFYMQIPIGQPLAGAFSIAARIMNGLSAIAGSTAGLELTEAGWQRRLDEWNHQVQILTIEVEQIELQILGAQRRRDQALRELNVQRRQMEQSVEVLNFLRDKFTAHDLYLYLQKDTSDLYFQIYELALHWACSAQCSFNLERGHTTRRFIPECAWNSLQEGLLAGERLETALHHMEKSYLDENVREYELTKNVSLREQFPLEYLRLRTTGYCEIDIPEWMFDQDYPGMYMRRIKSINLTVPCVTGPYNNVNCRLTLLSSVTRIDPRLDPPVHRCCCDRRHLCECELCPCDPRAVRQYAACEAIATSNGKSDSGMFELNFNDERYLHFEYRGAVSHWRIEMRKENNYWDPDTLSDVIMRVYYTAREGGDLLRRASSQCARKHLPGDGWCFFDVRHDFPDSWELLRTATGEEKRHKELSLRLTRRMFPYVPDGPEVRIDKITLLFEARRPEHRSCEVGECACLERKPPNSYEVKLVIRPECEGEREHDTVEAHCVSSGGCPDLYVGDFEIRTVPILGEVMLKFEFPSEIEELSRVFLFCHYTLLDSRALAHTGLDSRVTDPLGTATFAQGRHAIS
jgi:hypothetical protein